MEKKKLEADKLFVDVTSLENQVTTLAGLLDSIVRPTALLRCKELARVALREHGLWLSTFLNEEYAQRFLDATAATRAQSPKTQEAAKG
jgi:hypothetical protein